MDMILFIKYIDVDSFNKINKKQFYEQEPYLKIDFVVKSF